MQGAVVHHLAPPALGVAAVTDDAPRSSAFGDDEIIQTVFIDVENGGGGLLAPRIGQFKVACLGRKMPPCYVASELSPAGQSYRPRECSHSQPAFSDAHGQRPSFSTSSGSSPAPCYFNRQDAMDAPEVRASRLYCAGAVAAGGSIQTVCGTVRIG